VPNPGSGAERERAGGQGAGGRGAHYHEDAEGGDGSSERERVLLCRAPPAAADRGGLSRRLQVCACTYVRDCEFAGRMCGSGIAMRGGKVLKLTTSHTTCQAPGLSRATMMLHDVEIDGLPHGKGGGGILFLPILRIPIASVDVRTVHEDVAVLAVDGDKGDESVTLFAHAVRRGVWPLVVCV
jgi:hypothetical protein